VNGVRVAVHLGEGEAELLPFSENVAGYNSHGNAYTLWMNVLLPGMHNSLLRIAIRHIIFFQVNARAHTQTTQYRKLAQSV
jgi:hypothetical protein